MYHNGANNIYGNSVVSRHSALNVNFAFTSWINTITTLTEGILHNFYLFLESQNSYPSLKRLQIWRPISGSVYMLIWERIANVTVTGSHALYKVWLDFGGIVPVFYFDTGAIISLVVIT